MRLAIDDMRDYTTGQVDLICRTAETAKFILEHITTKRIEVEVLYLDHDLGDFLLNGDKILSIYLELGLLPQEVIITSSNPVGCNNIANTLKAYGYTPLRGNNRNWISP